MLSKEFCRRSRVKISNSVPPVGLEPRPLSSSLLALGVSSNNKSNSIRTLFQAKRNKYWRYHRHRHNSLHHRSQYRIPHPQRYTPHRCSCLCRTWRPSTRQSLTIITRASRNIKACCRQDASFFLQFLGTIKLANNKSVGKRTQTQWDASQGTSCPNISARSIRDSHLLSLFPRRSLNRADESGRDRDPWVPIHLINGLH